MRKNNAARVGAPQANRPSELDAVPYYRSIHDAMARPGCPLCRLLAEDADRYLDSVLWELVNDSVVRSELNRARGYCQQHGWMLVRSGAALGVAILMNGVLKALLDALEANPIDAEPNPAWHKVLSLLDRRDRPNAARDQTGQPAQLAQTLSPRIPCPVCSRLRDRENAYLSTMMSHLEDPGALADRLRASEGLCLAHFRLALGHAPDNKTANLLINVQQSIWKRLHAELTEFIRKNDHRYRDEAFGAEKDSWRRALEAISGPQPQSQSARQGLGQAL